MSIKSIICITFLFVFSAATRAEVTCSVDLLGKTTRCSDGTVYRTDLLGNIRDNRGNSWRTGPLGNLRGSDGTVCRTGPLGKLRCN